MPVVIRTGRAARSRQAAVQPGSSDAFPNPVLPGPRSAVTLGDPQNIADCHGKPLPKHYLPPPRSLTPFS